MTLRGTLPKRIYIDALALVPDRKSGVGMTLENTLKQLEQQLDEGYKIILVVPLRKAKYVKKYINRNVDVKTIPLPARLMELLLRLRLMPPVDWFTGKGIYVFPNYRNWPLWRSRSLTYIYDLSFLLFPETVRPKNQRYLSRYIRRWVARADEVVTISEQVKNELEKYLQVSYHKLHIIYCGVDTELYYPRKAKEIDMVKERYDIHYKNFFLFVGSVEPRKNIGTLIEAYAQLPDRVRSQNGLVIVGGDGWLNDTVLRRIEQLHQEGVTITRVKRYVPNEDLPALYSGATALVHPAHYEGFGMTPLEAMACQIPTVVADIPALHEVIGDCGAYVNPTDVQALSEVMCDVSSLGTNEMRRKQQARVTAFSWEAAATSLMSLVDKQRQTGPRKRVLIRLAVDALHVIDGKIRSSIGEKSLPAYRPKRAPNIDALREQVMADFFAEQPSLIQAGGLKLYLFLRRAVAAVARRSLQAIKGVRR